MLYDIASAYPSVDLTWANHFFATLFDHNRHIYAQEREDDQITTTVAVAAEFIEPHLNLKMYLKSRLLGMRETPLEVYKDAISQVCPVSAAATSLYEFLNNDPEGQLLKPAILGLDCVSAPISRIKLYFRTPRVRFTTIHTIMTLNNRKTVSAHQTESLRTLLAAVTGLPPDFSDDADWPINDRFKDLVYTRSAKIPLVHPACGFYFDMAPGREVPHVKVQLPLYVYGQQEQRLAECVAVAQWMKANGRGKFADRFVKVLPRLGDRDTAHGPDSVNEWSVEDASVVQVNGMDGTNRTQKTMAQGLQPHLSVMFTTDGQLEVTTYLVPVLSETPWVV